MKRGVVTIRQQTDPKRGRILPLLLLIALFLFAPHVGAEDTSDAKAAHGGCPHLQGKIKSAEADASTTGNAKCPCGKKRGVCLGWLKKQINLTEEQFEKMKQNKAAYVADTRELGDRIHDKGAEVDKLFRDPDAKEREIEKANREMIKWKGDLKEKRLRYALKMRAVLTPEQIRNLPPGALKGLLPRGSKGACPRSGKGKCPMGAQ